MRKPRTDQCAKIEIWWLLRDIKEKDGLKLSDISWGENGSHGSVSVKVSIWGDEKYVKFSYTNTNYWSGETKDFDYKVKLAETACHFGGTRYWFMCPLYIGGVACGRRVGCLYKEGDYFGCRHCYGLTYTSKVRSKHHLLYSSFRVMDLDKEINALQRTIKRQTYSGKPTKKILKLERLHEELFRHYGSFDRLESFINRAENGRNK